MCGFTSLLSRVYLVAGIFQLNCLIFMCEFNYNIWTFVSSAFRDLWVKKKRPPCKPVLLCLQPLCSMAVAPPPCSTQQPASLSFSSILHYYCGSLNCLQPYLTPVSNQVMKLKKLKLGLFVSVDWSPWCSPAETRAAVTTGRLFCGLINSLLLPYWHHCLPRLTCLEGKDLKEFGTQEFPSTRHGFRIR